MRLYAYNFEDRSPPRDFRAQPQQNRSPTAKKMKTPITIRAFRGQHGACCLQSRLGSITFVDDYAVAEYYAQNPNDRTQQKLESPTVLECDISLTNPLTNNGRDPYIDFEDLEKKVGTRLALGLMLRHSEYVTSTSVWEEIFSQRYGSLGDLVADDATQLKHLYVQVWPLLDHPQSVAELKNLGIDGAIHRGSAVSLDAVEYRVFDESQIKIVAVHPLLAKPPKPKI